MSFPSLKTHTIYYTWHFLRFSNTISIPFQRIEGHRSVSCVVTPGSILQMGLSRRSPAPLPDMCLIRVSIPGPLSLESYTLPSDLPHATIRVQVQIIFQRKDKLKKKIVIIQHPRTQIPNVYLCLETAIYP